MYSVLFSGLALAAGPSDLTDIVEMPPSDLTFRSRSIPSDPSRPDAGPQRCTVTALINTKGKIVEATASGCDEDYAKAAQASVKRWRFKPPRVDGKAVNAKTKLRIHYNGARNESSFPKHQQLEGATGTNCVVQAGIKRDEVPTDLRSSQPNSCVTRPTRAPAVVWDRIDQRTACTLQFKTRKGFLSDIGIEECPEDLVKPTIRMLDNWHFESPPEGMVYEFTAVYEP